MTTIAACSRFGVHAIAADGRAMCGGGYQNAKQVKLYATGDAVAGMAGSYEAIQLARATLAADSQTPEDFAREWKESMVAAGLQVIKEDCNLPDFGIRCLYVSTGGIWRIYGRMGAIRMEDDLPMAVGSGEEYAIGAMTSVFQVETAEEMSARDVVVHAGGGIMVATRGAETFGPEWIDEAKG